MIDGWKNKGSGPARSPKATAVFCQWQAGQALYTAYQAPG